MDPKEAKETLEQSLIFDMSLGSKELYHSNVWAWLLKTDPSFLEVFGLEEYIGRFYEVSREFAKRDLILWLDKYGNGKSEHHIVIENKIKSLPTYKQLEDYTENIGTAKFEKGILTGLGEASLDFGKPGKLKGKWEYLDYPTIAKRIREVAERCADTNEVIKSNLATIKEYCKVVDSINEGIMFWLKQDEKRLSYRCWPDEKEEDRRINLPKLRIDDVYKKLKGSHFLKYAEEKLKEDLEKDKPDGYNLLFGQSFHNGKTTLDIRYIREVKEESALPERIIGVQLEGNQFRFFAQTDVRKEDNIKDANALYDFFEAKKWFDENYDRDAKKGERMVHGKVTTMKPRNGKKKKYDSYQMDHYCFVYQYFDINEGNDSYDVLIGLIKEYMEEGSALIKELGGKWGKEGDEENGL